MLVSVVNLKCSNCGAPLAESMSRCPSCDQPVVIKKFSSLLGLASTDLNMRWRLLNNETVGGRNGALTSGADFTIGCCLLRLKMFDRALLSLGRVVTSDPYNVEALFCMAVAGLKGRRPFQVPLADIRKIQECLDAALLIDERAIFRYFLAYLKYDFYERHFLRVVPNWQQELQASIVLGLSAEEQSELINMVEDQGLKEFMNIS